MVTTTDSMITECEDHLLSGDRDALNELSVSLGASDTTITFSMPLDAISQGSYLGIDLEMIYIKSLDATSSVATVRRGMLGSTATTHTSGTLVYVNPVFSKWQIFKALNIEIASLSGADNGLFAETAFTLTTAAVKQTYPIPVLNNDIQDILEVRYDSLGPQKYWSVVPRRHCQIIRDVTTEAANTSGLAMRIEQDFQPGRSLVVRYQGEFTALSSTLTDNAATTTKLGTTMLDIPALGAAARLMAVKGAKRTLVDRSVDTRRAAEVPAGSSAQSFALLMQVCNDRIKSEAGRLRKRWPDAF